MSVAVFENAVSPDLAASCAAIHAAAFTAVGLRGWSSQEITALSERPSTILFTLPAGFLMLDIVVDEAEILTFAVLPTQQGQGLGHRLLRKMINYCTLRQVVRCVLEVASSSTTANHLYRKYEFKQISIRNAYFQGNSGPEDALVMERLFTKV